MGAVRSSRPQAEKTGEVSIPQATYETVRVLTTGRQHWLAALGFSQDSQYPAIRNFRFLPAEPPR